MVNEQLVERLDGAGLDPDVEVLVLAAALGDAELDDAIGGDAPDRPDPAPEADEEPERIYLDGITVEGFRGVGEKRTLGLIPGPGLTLVVGRNGSGKSSFAEAAEAALTGSTQRWAEKATTAWRDGWRNLHHHGPRSIQLRLRVDGQADATTIATTWPEGVSELDGGTTTVRIGNEPATTRDSLHLDDAIATWRPFLSYDDIGSLLTARPSDLHDRLSLLLGLEDWTEVETRLKERKKRLDTAAKQAKDEAKAIRALLGDSEDDRAATALAALGAQVRTWKLDDLEALVVDGPTVDSDLERLASLASLQGPDADRAEAIAAELHDAASTYEALRGTDADRADSLAKLLDQALAHQDAHGDDDCPVCGTPGSVGSDWAERARSEADAHRQQAERLRAAKAEIERLVGDARGLITPLPPLVASAPAGIDTTDLAAAWTRWANLPDQADATTTADLVSVAGAVADHLGSARAVADALPAVREAATAEHRRRQGDWQPIATRLAAWLPGARVAIGSSELTKQLDEAARWVRAASDEVRAERFAPIAEQVKSVWEQLRHDSNVSVDDLSLDGSSTRRRLQLAVTVDDTEAPGMAVLSQGELHALSLALFLPRATQDRSPFRFVMIDDPVQAMDAARVDGLTRVLDAIARDRQVVVFTHDERLPDACRRLGVDARVIEVSRQDRSTLHLRRIESPSRRLLADARAVVASPDYPIEARRRVVPGLCRQALEAVAVDLGRQRLLRAGVPFPDVEDRIRSITRTVPRLALGLFGDENRDNDVYGKLNRTAGPDAVDVVKSLNRAAHGLVDDDPQRYIDLVATMVDDLEADLRTGSRP